MATTAICGDMYLEAAKKRSCATKQPSYYPQSATT